MKVFFFISALCWVAIPPTGSQTPRAYETAALAAYDSKDYYAAMKYYEQVMDIEPGRPEIMLKFADAARQFGALKAAEQAYEKVLRSDRSSEFAQAAFWLANVKKTMGKYDQAISWYEQYKTLPGADAPLCIKAANEIDICEWALEQINHPDITVLIERLPEEPNTGLSEFSAHLQGRVMYYSAFRNVPWKDRHKPSRPLLRIMQYEAGLPPVVAPFFNVPQRHAANLTLSADGTTAVFSQCDYTGEIQIQCELYFSRNTGNGWSEPVPLPTEINVPGYTATQPHLSENDNGAFTLYFVSDRPGGEGGLDIWTTVVQPDGACSVPVNLSELNTPEDEATPCFFAPEQSLYFSSTGWPTLGGFDIYKSKLNGSHFQQPEHLSIPINSSFNDLYFAPISDTGAYFASNRIGSSNLDSDACCLDIYQSTALPINLEAVSISEMTGETLEQVDFSLEATDEAWRTRFDADGSRFVAEVKRDRSYRIIAAKAGYLPDTVLLNTGIIPPDRRFVKKLQLKPEIKLAIKTYNQLSEEIMTDADIRLIELSNPGENSHTLRSTSMLLDFRKKYLAIVEKDGFYPDSMLITGEEIRSAGPGNVLSRNVFLTPATLSGYLPLTLYFDNDQPKPGPRLQSYDQVCAEYLSKRDTFIHAFTCAMNDAEKALAGERLQRFFSEEVQGGYLKLEYFAENLDLFLENNYNVTVMVKGFASPLANAEYNLALTKRRIASVLSYFRKYHNGIYAPYIHNGQLQVMTAPLGETLATPGISDDRGNRRLSVYSVEASRERRTEIIEVQLTKK